MPASKHGKKLKKVSTGISISMWAFELATFAEKKGAVETASIVATPPGLFDPTGDQIVNLNLLKSTFEQLLGGIDKKPKEVNLSLPASLLRLSEIPRLDSSQLFLSLSSEAERYKPFEGTEAAIDYHIAENIPAANPQAMQVVLGGVRQDTLETIIKTLRSCGVKVVNIDIEPLCTLRGMAVTGVLDSLLDQMGDDAIWGVVFADPGRVRFSLWQGQELLELRETSMDTSGFAEPDSNPFLIEDLMEEMKRTVKSWQPAIWLHNNLPFEVASRLENGLGIPVRPCPRGDAISLPNPDLSLAVIGSALVSTVAYPFSFNIPPNPSKQSLATEENDDSNTPELLMGAGGLLIALSLVATGILFLLNMFMFGPAVQDKENQKTQLEGQIASLEQQKQQLSTSGQLQEGLAYTAQRAKMRGQVYIRLVESLRNNVPSTLWIQNLTAGETLAVEGKALSHQDILDFSKTFDDEAYITGSMIQTIQEERLAGKALFDYELSGDIDVTQVNMSDAESEFSDTSTLDTDQEASNLEDPDAIGEEAQ